MAKFDRGTVGLADGREIPIADVLVTGPPTRREELVAYCAALQDASLGRGVTPAEALFLDAAAEVLADGLWPTASEEARLLAIYDRVFPDRRGDV